MSNIIETTLNFPALACGDEENTNFQRMSIAYSIGEHAEADLIKIRTSVSSEEKKQRQIFEILLNENNCRGYFFDCVPRMNFKHLYLETCNDTLDTYIRKSAMNSNFQWTILQEICCQLVDSVAWLHQRKFYYNGHLHPRNIFIKTCDSPWKVKLHLSEKANPFHSLDTEYVSSWTGIKQSDLLDKSVDEIAILKDLVSVTILMFFIQSSGGHPFQRANSSLHPAERENYQCIQNQIKEGIFTLDALDRKCFCAANENENCEETQCKYRLWVNMLAKDRTDSMLTELFYETKSYNNESSGKLMEHPFFWKTSEVLRFIEKSSNYLKEAGDVKKKSLFGSSSQEQTNANGKIRIKKDSLVAIQRSQVHQPWLLDPVLLSKIKKNHKNIFDYLHETPAKKPVPDMEFFCGLLSQIRNKSSHWNETTECGTKAKEDLKNMSFVADNEMDAQLKFCLFWNIHFPELILYTWKNLKDVIAHQ